jgi:signal transduction histidine kinase
MDMLVNDFLSVSKFELGTLVPEFTQVDLDTFFESVLDEHTPMAEQKSVHIETVWPQDLGQMRSDSHLLHMITNNLLSNAIKYTPAGGVVRFNIALQPGKLVLTIADTGIGIPLEDQEMIFSKMFRASNARSQVADGTGLGLYIVKEAAEILGGTVSFESKEGRGTAFTVVLPKQ